MDIQKIEEEKLQQLAADPDNIVYKYEDTPTPATILSLDTVKENIEQLWQEFLQMKGNRVLTFSDCRQFRSKLESTNPKWAAFSKSHPLIFDRVVDHRTGEAEIKALLHMIRLRERQNDGEISDGAEKLHSYILKKFAVSESEYKAKNKNARIVKPE